jgi:hypothetical protein
MTKKEEQERKKAVLAIQSTGPVRERTDVPEGDN